MIAPAKRPLSLTLALCAALALAMGGSQDALQDFAIFRGDASADTMVEWTEAQRLVTEPALQHFFHVVDLHRNAGRGFAAAIVTVSAVMFFLAMRAFSRRAGPPNILPQMVIAQAALLLVQYASIPELRWAKRNLAFALSEAHTMPLLQTEEDKRQSQSMNRVLHRVLPVAQFGYLSLRTVLSLLIVAGIRRRRAAAYYEPVVPRES